MSGSLDKALMAYLVDLLFQLEKASEDQMDDDFSIQMMEAVGADLQSLGEDAKADLVAMLNGMAAMEKNNDRKEYLEGFPENFGLVD